MAKIDLKKELKYLYGPSAREPVMVDVPPLKFLMVDGQGDPNNSREYAEALEALYAVGYTLKFMAKGQDPDMDYTVMPLEGLWWSEDMDSFLTGAKDKWLWTSLMMQPDFITDEMVAEAREGVRRKKDPVALDKLRFETFEEGKSAHIMYFGPFADEGPTIQRIHDFIEEQGCTRRGLHHEIYLSDPRRTAPEKLRTVIRQPCE